MAKKASAKRKKENVPKPPGALKRAGSRAGRSAEASQKTGAPGPVAKSKGAARSGKRYMASEDVQNKVVAEAAYGQALAIKNPFVFLVNKKLHDLYAMPRRDKIGVIKAGISKQQLTTIKAEIEVDYDELSEVLGTSRATLINKKKSERFDPQVSEKIVMLNDVLFYGREIFGDNDNFNEWLKSPSEALGNVTPLSIMDTLYGIDEVKKEIGRIAYGVY